MDANVILITLVFTVTYEVEGSKITGLALCTW